MTLHDDRLRAEAGGAAGAPPGPARRRDRLGTRVRRTAAAANQYTGVLTVLVLLVVVLAVSQEQFLSWENFVNIAETNAVLLIVATGLTFVLLTGAIDLSVGGTMALVAISLWELLGAGLPTPLAVVLVVALGFAVGFLVNGLLIGVVGLSFLVVTIGTASAFRGIAQVRSQGQSQSLYTDQTLVAFGSDRWFGVPITVYLAGAVFVLALLLLRYTGFGRMVYAVGGNPQAARHAGINVAFVRVAVFGICAGLAALASVVDVSRLTSASPNAGLGIELTAGAAVLLGGTSFMGGRGTLLGTLLGVLFLGVLSNGLTLAGISPFWTGVVSGTVLIAAILLDRLRNGAAAP